MSEITPTAARVVKKGLWKDIYRWVHDDSLSEPLQFDGYNKRKRMPRLLEAYKKHRGDFYAGAILFEAARYPSRNKLIVLTWSAYVESKRLAVTPVLYDSKMETSDQHGVAFTEHAIERMAERLETLKRIEILQELTAIAMPACILAWSDETLADHGDYFAVKTPHGIGVLAINHEEDPDMLAYLITWISNEEATARKFREIEWVIFSKRQKHAGLTFTIDIPVGAKLYLSHKLENAWARQIIADDRRRAKR